MTKRRYCLICEEIKDFKFEESTKHSQCICCAGHNAISIETAKKQKLI